MENTLKSLLVPIKMGPLVADPTGGLLQPVLGPINYIVGAMEDSILTTIKDALVITKFGLTEGTKDINGFIEDSFRIIFKEAKSIVAQASNLLKSTISTIDDLANDEMDDVFSVLISIENVVNNILKTIDQTSVKLIGETSSSLKNTVDSIVQELRTFARDEFSKSSVTPTLSLDNGIRMVNTYVSDAINNAAVEIRRILNTTVSELKQITSQLKSGLRNGTSRIRAARGRIVSYGEIAEKEIPGFSDFHGDIVYIENRGKSIESMLSTLSVVSKIITLGIILIAIVATFRIYMMLFKPLFKRNQ